MESLAEYYSAELAQKLRRGQRESALKCIALGGNRSFGYDIGPDKHYCMMELQAKEQEPKGNPEKDALEAELAECRRKQNNILEAIEEGGSARLAARLRTLEEQEAQLTFALGEINNAPAPPQFSREALTFMFEQFGPMSRFSTS